MAHWSWCKIVCQNYWLPYKWPICILIRLGCSVSVVKLSYQYLQNLLQFKAIFCHQLLVVGSQAIWNKPPHDKMNKMACAPSEDSDQPGYLPSLITVFAVRFKKAWVLSYPLSTQRRLIWVFAGRTVILLVLSWGGSNVNGWKNWFGVTFYMQLV